MTRTSATDGDRREAPSAHEPTDPQDEASTPFGQYRWDTHADRWAWSQGMFVVHGYPGPVVRPSTALVLDHKEPSDRGRAAALLERARSTTSSYVNHHRIVDATGRTRTVLTVGASAPNADHTLVSSGFVADLTDVERLAGTAAVRVAAEGRAAINQSQGAVMAVLGLSADAALAMLVWYSQSHHLKLKTLCQSLVAGLSRHGAVTAPDQLARLLDVASRPGEPNGV